MRLLVGTGDGNGREEDFQQEVVAVNLPFHGIRNDLNARTVIPLGIEAGQEGEKQKDQASDQSLHIAAGEELLLHG